MPRFIFNSGFNSKIIAGIIVLGVLVFLFLSGPASAFNFGLNIIDNIVQKGRVINFTAFVESQESDAEIDYLILRLKGPSELPRNFDCKFFSNGTKDNSEGCRGINITRISSTPNGYGYGYCGIYGYGYGCDEKNIYFITLNTGKYVAGTYESYLIIVDKNKKTNEERGSDIIITTGIEGLKRCSLRAFDGNLNIENLKFTNNRINFYLRTFKNEIRGNGVLNGEKGKERFNYRFEVRKVIENDKNHAVIFANGAYKVGKNGRKSENALIIFDKINNKIEIIGNDINIKSMNVNFRVGC